MLYVKKPKYLRKDLIEHKKNTNKEKERLKNIKLKNFKKFYKDAFVYVLSLIILKNGEVTNYWCHTILSLMQVNHGIKNIIHNAYKKLIFNQEVINKEMASYQLRE